MEIDASPHLPLIHRVIGQMGLQGDEKEEAFSEALVAIVEAAKKYDPNRNVPLANWLAKNIRWSIANWLDRQHYTVQMPMTIEAPKVGLSDVAELNEVLAKARAVLTPQEHQILMATAYGYKGIEIAKALGISTGQVSWIKTTAQKKMAEIFLN